MKQNKIKQFIILDQNEAGFAFDLNESLRKLADQDAVATFDGDRCRIEYTMTVEQEAPRSLTRDTPVSAIFDHIYHSSFAP